MLRRSDPINGTVFKKPYSLIFGNEATGLPDSFADFTNPVRIMHTSDIDSLNLPIAAAIVCFRRRRKSLKCEIESAEKRRFYIPQILRFLLVAFTFAE